MAEDATLKLFQSDSYRSAAAAEKQNALWQAILDTRYPSLPPVKFSYIWSVVRGFIIYALRKPFVTVSDVRRPRSKMFHPWGTAAKMRYVADGKHPYTGLFATGARGLVRLSLAMDVDRFSPGGGFKFLIDGQPSQNLVTVPGLDPFKSRNFFGWPLTNVLAAPTGPPFSRGWFFTYTWMSKVANPLVQPLGHLARVTAGGETVAQAKAPYCVFLRAAEDIGFDPATRQDFRDELSTRIKPGTILYRMYGIAEEGGAEEVYLGHFVTESGFVAASFVDKMLAFEHAREPVSKYEWRLAIFVGAVVLAIAVLVIIAAKVFF
jgi:hypothetical protein